MRLVECRKQDIPLYLKFTNSIYQDKPNYKNNTEWTAKQILTGKSVFCDKACVLPVFIYNQNVMVAVCTYIQAEAFPEYLQIAFFEALEHQTEAILMIMEHAKSICAERHISKICVGLNGHVNYGFGLLADQFASPVAFGDSYNPAYYLDYFAPYATKEYALSSFRTEVGNVDADFLAKITAKFCGKFTFRKSNFRNFKQDMALYTSLNNLCFADHPFYYPRTDAEDYELFKALQLFMRAENLIFAEHEGKTIGFLLWYPDFNLLVPPGKSVGVDTYIKNKLFARRVKRFKMVEIGVLPEYQQSGAIVGLFYQCYLYAKDHFTHFATSWIWDENHNSRNFGVRLMDEEYKHYKVFEIEI